MDAREQRGLVIAATTKLENANGAWLVPSQSKNGCYTVKQAGEGYRCNCPDHEARGVKCKHIFAVEYTVSRESVTEIGTNAKGETTVTKTERLTVTEKVTYKQDWTAYNAAQTSEKRMFLPLLQDLCRSVDEPEQTMGRPRLPLGDMIFAATYKVYAGVSGRRFASDLEDAQEKGFIAKAPHFNSVFNCLEAENITPILQSLIAQSALPLQAVETDFAVDSSGFGTTRYIKWLDVKHHGQVSKHDWVKVHLICGVKTNIVAAADVSDRNANDTLFLQPLVNATAANFSIAEVSADKAYSSVKNHAAIEKAGGTAYIAFKSNASGKSNRAKYQEGAATWTRMYHYFSFNQPDFLAHYHKRSNVESTFAMIKGKFGDGLKSKSTTAQVNEALLKVLCHNICVVIQSIYELGIEPVFAQAT